MIKDDGNYSAIILAGGLGTRLRSVVSNTPKPLAHIEGIPFIDFVLNQLRKNQIFNVVLSLYYEAHQIVNYLEKNVRPDMKINYVIENEPLGTGGAVNYVISNFPVPELSLVVNGDTYVDFCFKDMLRSLKKKPDLGCIGLVKVPNISRYGAVSLNSDNFITKFKEKGEAGAGLVNAGVYLLSSACFRSENRKKYSLENDLFPELLIKNKLKGTIFHGDFFDIGTPEDYLRFCEKFKSGAIPSPKEDNK